jgi:large subunit ribosomal protein L29
MARQEARTESRPSLGTDFMKAEKIRNLTDVELKHQERDLADQLFKLKFQMNMGQTESLKKIRGLRRDIARVQTVLREQELAGRKTEKK